ncbi:MAG: RHS repeat-associated core domain-containing protein [Planctomycetota bacterium]
MNHPVEISPSRSGQRVADIAFPSRKLASRVSRLLPLLSLLFFVLTPNAAFGMYTYRGKPVSAFGYSGMWRDTATGLYHTHYREYNPEMGRWLTPDPAGYRDGQNLYAYYPGPNGVDPLGLKTLGDYEKIKADVEDAGLDALKETLGDKYEAYIGYKGIGSSPLTLEERDAIEPIREAVRQVQDYCDARMGLINAVADWYNSGALVQLAAPTEGRFKKTVNVSKSPLYQKPEELDDESIKFSVMLKSASFDENVRPFAEAVEPAVNVVNNVWLFAGVVGAVRVGGAKLLGARLMAREAEGIATLESAKRFLPVGPGAATRGELFSHPWIQRDLFKDLPKRVGKGDFNKFKSALKKGIVGPTGESGIKILRDSVGKYTHELKIGGSAQRLVGYIDENEVLVFDKFMRGGLH